MRFKWEYIPIVGFAAAFLSAVRRKKEWTDEEREAHTEMMRNAFAATAVFIILLGLVLRFLFKK